MMIKTFGDDATADLYHGRATSRVRRFPNNIVASALRKMDMLEAATTLHELQKVPGNRFEKMHGDLAGYYSIRINDQWRVIFQWDNGDAILVKVTDYHKK